MLSLEEQGFFLIQNIYQLIPFSPLFFMKSQLLFYPTLMLAPSVPNIGKWTLSFFPVGPL
jgi:hypothetical protein